MEDKLMAMVSKKEVMLFGGLILSGLGAFLTLQLLPSATWALIISGALSAITLIMAILTVWHLISKLKSLSNTDKKSTTNIRRKAAALVAGFLALAMVISIVASAFI